MIRRSALFKIRHRRNAEEVALESTGRYLFPKGDFGSDLANAGLILDKVPTGCLPGSAHCRQILGIAACLTRPFLMRFGRRRKFLILSKHLARYRRRVFHLSFVDNL